MYIATGIVLLTLFFLLYQKIVNNKKAVSVKDYFFADRNTDSDDFISSTVAYGYQIAALALFASWGYIYGFWTIWVPIFWGIGFLLLKYLNDKNKLDIFLECEETLTIHGFLSKMYKNRYISIIAGVATLIGLSGTAFFEAEFTSDIIVSSSKFDFLKQNILGLDINWLFIFFVSVTLIYVLYGGLKAVISSDKLQLKFGYIFFNLFIIYTFVKIIQNGYIWTGFILLFASLFVSLILLYFYSKLNKLNAIVFKHKYTSTILVSSFSYVIALFYLTFNLVFDKSYEPYIIKDSITFFYENQQMSNFLSLGNLSLISLLLANALWQIVDISNWQRLSALKDPLSKKNEISKALSFTAIYSPITWLLAIFFGMGLKYCGTEVTDAWSALNEFTSNSFHSGSTIDIAFVIILILSMIFIMFSTLDSIICSISFTTYFDIIKKNKESLLEGRLYTAIYTMLFMLIYILLRQRVSDIDSILYTFYSFQLALFPSIMAIFISKKINSYAANASIIGGSLLTVIPLYINSDFINPYSASALFSVMGSIVIYLVVNLLVSSKSIKLKS
ncbi:hypothetical protein [Polaribacter aestuariivivens]|uniref:hypothetical protein n=1 Tax=Polaribacter aestuariivivens TaxID=2304626 RepID=UPI003F49B1B7